MDNDTEKIESTGSTIEPIDLISNANKAAERLENANKELAKLIATQQQMQLKRILDGNADTGVKQESQEEKEIKEARQFLNGTGLEDYAFPPDKP